MRKINSLGSVKRVVAAVLALLMTVPSVAQAKNDNDKGNSSDARSTTTTTVAASSSSSSSARGNSGNAGNSGSAGNSGNSSGAAATTSTTVATRQLPHEQRHPGVVGSAGTGSPNLLAYLPGATTPTDPGTPTNPGTPATAPAQPGAPTAEARNKAAVVSWSLPSDGGSAITSQTIRAYSAGRVVATLRVDGITTTTRISRLRNGTDYSLTVQATNAVGSSAESAQSNVVQPTR